MRPVLFGLICGFSFLSSTAAYSACSTASLAGTWKTIGQASANYDLIVCSATISTLGVISNVSCSNGEKFTGTLALSSSCVITGSIASIAVRGRTNPIPSTDASVPTLATVASTNAAIAFTAFRN